MEMSEILGGAPAPVEPVSTVETAPVAEIAAPPAEPTSTVVEPAERPRDEHGRFARTEPAAATTAAPVETPHMVPVAAMLAERRKWQELQQRIDAQQKPAVDENEFWTAPLKTTEQVVDHRVGGLQQEIVNIKYQMAEDFARQLHPDYDSVRDAFIARVTMNDPTAVAIAQQMGQQANPARFIYEQSKRLQQLEQVGDLGNFEARIRAEERAKVLIEMQRPGAAPAVPRSLNSEPSAPTSSAPADFGPTPLANLFDRKF